MEIRWLNPETFPQSERRKAEDRIIALAARARDVTEVRIATRPSGHHRHAWKEVRITCDVHGHPVVAARTRNDLGQALRDALDLLGSELEHTRARCAQQVGRPALEKLGGRWLAAAGMGRRRS